MSAPTPAVLVADDHAPTRQLVADAIERSRSFHVVATAFDAPSSVEAAVREVPDVCVLDINMPGGGISAAAQIAQRLPDCSIVMLTVSRNDEDLFDALRAGASGYLLKGLDDEELVTSLERVLAVEACLPGSLVSRLVEEFRDREQRRVAIGDGRTARLTGREWDVLELMRRSATTSEIASRLFVSPTTVRTHVSSILRKLQVRTRSQAVELLERTSR